MDPAWEDYRRRRRGFWLALVLLPLWLIPGALIQEFLARRGFGGTHWINFPAVLVPPMIHPVVAYFRRIFWPCPRCGRPFFLTWSGCNWFARRCLHCGLPKWAPAQGPAQADAA
jgi:hypothetical protein